VQPPSLRAGRRARLYGANAEERSVGNLSPPERAMNGERDGGGGVTCPDGWLDHHVDSSVAVSRRRHCWRGAVGFLGVIGPFGFS